jgi:cardiolipin synthase
MPEPARDREVAAPFGRGRIRRIFGLDRSGPEPPQTRAGQPLRPFTLPNAVGFLRLALLPVFLLLAFASEEGRGLAIGLIYFAIAAGDYLDGLLARLTGQYSRLGALLDPVIDRLTILAGAIVAWHFELLPRWAIALLALRELVMLVIGQWGLRNGVDIKVNWPGRIAVFPLMGAIFLALLVETPISSWLLVIGLAFTYCATLLYIRDGLRQVKLR